MKKNNKAGNSLNAVEREPVETRVLNPNATEASYKPKQRSYSKTKLNKIIFLLSFFLGGFCRGDFIREPKYIPSFYLQFDINLISPTVIS